MDKLNLRGDTEPDVIEGWITRCCGSSEERMKVVGQIEEEGVGSDQAVTNE